MSIYDKQDKIPELKKPAVRAILKGEEGNFDSIRPTAEYTAIMRRVSAKNDAILKKLPSDLRGLYEEYQAALRELDYESAMTYFEEGFKLGIRIGFEAGENKPV